MATFAHIQLAICDDRQEDGAQTEALVTKILEEEHISATVSRFESAGQLLEAAGQNVFHILLLDVLMDGMDGIALAGKLREMGSAAAVIFTSVSLEMALRGYRVAAVRYLIKPLNEELLREALLFCYNACLRRHKLLLTTPKGESRVDPAEILCAESQNRGLLLSLTSGQIAVAMKISDLAEMLPKNQYVFCHRTILVNLDYVDHVRNGELELKDGRRLPISRYRFTQLRFQFLNYLNA